MRLIKTIINNYQSILGLETWLVANKNLDFYKTFEEVPNNLVTVIRPQMFPPKPEEKDKYNLNRW